MKKVLSLFIILVSLTACNMGTTSVIRDNNFHELQINNNIKQAEACNVYIPLLLIAGPLAREDASVVQIAKKKNITKVEYVEEKVSYILPAYYMKCYVVYGY